MSLLGPLQSVALSLSSPRYLVRFHCSSSLSLEPVLSSGWRQRSPIRHVVFVKRFCSCVLLFPVPTCGVITHSSLPKRTVPRRSGRARVYRGRRSRRSGRWLRRGPDGRSPFVSPLHQVQVFVGFLAENHSSFIEFQWSVVERCHIVVCCRAGASWGYGGRSRWRLRKCQTK